MAAKDLRTIFIRGISFDADEKALEQLFSDVGPVKQCFLVRVKGQPRHRGFGFVQYALPEDAERAVTECNGKALMGRKLQVELADKRAPLEERKKKRKLGQDGAADAGENAADDAGDKGPAAKGQSDKPATAAAGKTAAGKAQPEADGKPDAGATPAAVTAAAAAPPRKRQRADGAAAGAPAAEKHKLLRAVAIGNLTPAVIAQAVALARKAGPVEEVMNPAPADVVQQAKLEADGCSGSVVIVIYKTVKDAMHAVTQLHNKTLELRSNQQRQQQQKGRKGKKQRGKGRGEDEEEDEEGAAEAHANGAGGDAEEGAGAQQRITMWAREVKGEGAHVKQWRVILRNLPFKITEAALQKALQSVGFVWELKLPRGPDGRLKGFAFAAFTCRAHAEKAIALLNGKDLMGRMVVVDWAVSKTQYLQGAGAGAAAEGAADAAGKEATGSEDPDRPSSESEDPDAGTDEEEDDEEEEGADDDDDDDDDDEGEEEEIGLSSDEDDEVLDDDEDEDDEEDEDEDEDGEDEEGDDDGEEEDEEEEAGAEDPEARRERGMLSNVLAAVLAEHEQPQQGEHTAAATAAGVKACKATAAAVAAPKGGKQAQQQPQQPPKRQAWQGEEAYDPDAGAEEEGRTRGAPGKPAPSSSLSTTVFVRGLPLDATSVQLQARLELFGAVKACRLVMDKASGKPKGTAFVEFREEEEAGKAAAACARGRRNEGPGITLGGRQLEVDLAVSGEDARSIVTQRLASKTASKDRRNMYLTKEGHITEGSPAWNGMSAHDQAKRKRAAEEKNVKLRSPNFVISRTRLSVRNIPPGWTEAQLRRMFAAAVKERATKEEPRVVQAKILRETDKYDASGARKSKGLGFVEFESHDHALAALRQLNNNPGSPWGRERRPIVEFAIDNVKVLKKIEDFKEKAKARQQQQQQQQAGGKAKGEADGAAADAKDGDVASGRAEQKKGRKDRGRGREADGGGGVAEADANGGAGPTDASGGQGQGKGKGKKAAKPKQERRAEASGGDGGDGEGEGEGAVLSKRQRKRQRQKDRVERKKALLKEGGVQALVAAVEADKQQRQQGGSGGAAKGGEAAAAGVGGGKAAGKKGAQANKHKGAPAPQPQRQQQQQQQPQQRKRRAEDDELTRIANEGLAAAASARGGAVPAKRRRRGVAEEGEGGDRLDRLVAQYRAKLSGERPRPGPGGDKNKAGANERAINARSIAAGGGKGGNGAGAAAAAAAAKGVKGGGGGKGAAGVADLVVGAASGGLRRWFDG